MTKYILEGLDCAHCAGEIETNLRKIDGLGLVQVNFATQTIHLDERLKSQAQEVISRIEPKVVLISAATKVPTKHSGVFRGEGSRNAVRILIALVLFAMGFGTQVVLDHTLGSGASTLVFLLAYVIAGYPVLWGAAQSIFRGQVFNELFLMSLATLGAIAIQQVPEAVGVMLFYAVGEFFQNRAVARSRQSISDLMHLRPEFARVVVNGAREERSPETVAVGDLVEVLPGERIPLDGEIEEGDSFVDTASLTGESVPRRVGPGSAVLSGFVNDSGRLLVRVTQPFGQSSAARILDLVENAGAHKAPTERFITQFAAYYTPAIVLISALVAILPPLVLPGALWEDWVYRALVILVISCPCALVLSIPLGYFGGIGGAARNQVLVKGAGVLDTLNRADTVVFDKTGTLTKGVFAVSEVVPRPGFTPDQVLGWAAAAEGHSSHPIARSILQAYGGRTGAATNIVETKGFGVVAQVEGQTVHAGSGRLLSRDGIAYHEGHAGGTVVHVAVNQVYAGCIVVSDQVKDEAASVVEELRRQGVRRVVMLTGDDSSVAARVAGSVGIGEYFAQQLPEDKVSRLEQLMMETPAGGKVVFVGDGMNDAPVLVRADVGFAMGGLGSDAAIEAADVVVMDDRLTRIPQALRIARFTRTVVWQNITLALAVKAVFVALGTLGVANMWEAVIADVGVSILAVFNAMRTIRQAGEPRY